MEETTSTITHRFPRADLRRFAFERYPAFFDIRVDAGQFAWKPAIIADVVEEFARPVVWMDAGNMLEGDARRLRRILRKRGFYAARSSGVIRQWTHEGTLSYLGAAPELLEKANFSSSCVAFNPAFPNVVQLLRQWRDCSAVRACIAPEGSDRYNHRQDQSVLSILAYQRGLAPGPARRAMGVREHRDID